MVVFNFCIAVPLCFCPGTHVSVVRQCGGNGPEKVRMRGKSSPNLATGGFGKSRNLRYGITMLRRGDSVVALAALQQQTEFHAFA